MNVIIVEDESPALKRMRQLIAAAPMPLEILAEARSGKTAIEQIDSLAPDAIFLDIHLMDMTGFEVLSRIQHNPYVIFTTAYHEYALQAFEHLSIDYLLKPFDQVRFNKALEKLSTLQAASSENAFTAFRTWMQNNGKRPQSLPIKDKDRIHLIAFEEVAYFKAADKYVSVILRNGKEHLLTKSLTQLQLELPDNFLRVHRSYIVNRQLVFQLQRYFKGRFLLKLNDHQHTTITSSEAYQTQIKLAFGI